MSLLWLFSPGVASAHITGFLAPAAPELFHDSTLDTEICRPKKGIWRGKVHSSSKSLPYAALSKITARLTEGPSGLVTNQS